MSELHFRARLARPHFVLDVDLQLAARGVTALFGASGSGKTSLLRVIAGLEPQAQGRIAVGSAVWQDSHSRVFVPVHQRALGYVFQEPSLFPHLSVQANLKFGWSRTPAAQRRHGWAEVLELSDMLGLSPLLQRWPHTLSGGERQRVAIARALAASPQVVLLDEPLAALDAARKSEILHYLERLQHIPALAMLYVTHAIDEVARLADHVVLLEQGRVIGQGPVAAMLTRLDLALAQDDAASAVLSCAVQSHDDSDQLTTATFSGGTLVVARQQRPVGSALRVRVQARDVSLTLQHQSGTSILNIFPVTVMALTQDSRGHTVVALDAAGSTLLARVTTRSARALELRPGLAVYAQVKGAAVLG